MRVRTLHIRSQFIDFDAKESDEDGNDEPPRGVEQSQVSAIDASHATHSSLTRFPVQMANVITFVTVVGAVTLAAFAAARFRKSRRSEEHTSELQSRVD